MEPRGPAAHHGFYPPKNKTRGRSAACCCWGGIAKCCLGCVCDLFRCCFGCILTFACQIFCTFLVFVAVVALIVWLLFRPTNLEFHADGASLADFRLDRSNTLLYELAVNISARNPNERLQIRYEGIEASAHYKEHWFAGEVLPRFSLDTGSTRAITSAFRGQRTGFTLGDEERAEYEKEKNSGIFSIDVKVQLKIRAQLWIVPAPFSLKPSFVCPISVPLSSSGKTFQGTDCIFDWHALYSNA